MAASSAPTSAPPDGDLDEETAYCWITRDHSLGYVLLDRDIERIEITDADEDENATDDVDLLARLAVATSIVYLSGMGEALDSAYARRHHPQLTERLRQHGSDPHLLRSTNLTNLIRNSTIRSC